MGGPGVSDHTSRGVIPLSEPLLAGNEARYVADCVETGWVSSVGAYVDRFEGEMAAFTGSAHAVATVNGTAALHVSMLVAGVERDDEVVMPTLTFIAPANAVRYVSAWPVFLDVEPGSWQLDVDVVERFLLEGCEQRAGGTFDRATGRRVRAILAVDILGHPCDLERLSALAAEYRLALVEDATESLGATLNGRGAGTLGDIGCLSFNGNKIMTTGGGGMILMRHREQAERAHHLTTQAKIDPIEYIHGEVGFNYRLTNIQAALGCAQLEQLDGFLARKRQIAASYQAGLAGVPGIGTMEVSDAVSCSWWLYTITVDPTVCATDSRGLMAELARRSITSRPLWQPLHQSPAHPGSRSLACPVAEGLYARALSLPSSVSLTAFDQERVIESVRQALTGRD